MPAKIPTDESGVTYSRKPYITGDDSTDYVDQMRRVPRRAIEHQRETPRSNLDKPYVTEDYQEMEHFQPLPIPDPYTPDPMPDPTPGPVPDVDDVVPSENVCALTILPPFKCCCESTENESRLEFCRAKVNAIIVPAQYTSTWINYVHVLHNGSECTLHEKGGPFPIHAESASVDEQWAKGDKILAYLDFPDLGMLCSEIAYVNCFDDTNCCNCDDPPEGTLEFDDDNTPDTIAKGSSIDVYITGGCPPFTWSVSGGDCSFTEATTNVRVNTLTHDDST